MAQKPTKAELEIKNNNLRNQLIAANKIFATLERDAKLNENLRVYLGELKSERREEFDLLRKNHVRFWL